MDTATSLLSAAAAPALDRIRQTLNHLGCAPPQVLLLEGGLEEQRRELALYWAARCNCPQAAALNAPCLSCPVCLQIASGEFTDLCAYDGRISNRDDEENPGTTRAFNMQQARALKSRLRDAPRHGGRRVVVLMGLSLNRDEAANALLKVLEEPSASSVFVLLTPQREQLLPTLVSRSFCLTLPWPDCHARDTELAPWEDALADFLRDGRGLFERTAAKNALDAESAARIITGLRKAVSRVLAGEADSALEAALGGLTAQGLAACCRFLDEAQDMLRYAVTPARVLEALAARLFCLRRGC